jgi:chromosome segregation ATPase
VITLCTDRARCAALEAAHADLSEQLAAVQGRLQQTDAQIALKEQEIATLRAKLDQVRADYQFYFQSFCAALAQKGQ